ncbi:MAG: DnaJ domain-containing protein [Campylobacterota bacterium]|nr:DnaJ domain-containing protein [Campylobacterota bacterium]
MKTLLGVAVIAFGVFLEITWLGICFGTVIIGILLLIFAPSILFFPFNFFLVIGLSIINGKPYKTSSRFKYQEYSNQHTSYQNQDDNLDKYYKILESSKTDSFDLIKKRYRTLIKKYHYDSIASKNLPEDMVKFAEQKTQDLNEAYSVIKKVKG